MKLSFVQKARSIAAFEDIELPDFTVLTGLNGAGKTHLLRNIKDGKISVEGISPSGIHYYDSLSYRYKEPPALNVQQIKQQTDQSWLLFKGSGKPNVNWMSKAQQIYERIFGKNENLESNIWTSRSPDLQDAEKYDQYEKSIESQIFSNPNFLKHQKHHEIKNALKKVHKPLHAIDSEEFGEMFTPNSQSEHLLSWSLSVIFTKYKIKQFLWAHKQFDCGVSKPSAQLYQEFEVTQTPPWKLVNDVLRTIHQYGGERSVFNFEVTDPSDEVLMVDSYQNYVFSPQLTDRELGQPRSFTDLSSGEQTLLALAISIFQTSDSYQLPDLLLLDEIDSSLHPSMAKAMLNTLQDIFVARGTSVILATHSPSTVALAPNESVHLISKSDGSVTASRATQGEAIQILSEGFVALSDNAMSMLSILPDNKLAVLTEGDNAKILKRLFELKKIDFVEVIEGVEDRTGDGDIRNFFNLLSNIGYRGKLLCIWDCDCQKKHGKLKPSGNIFPYVIPQNPENTLSNKGIENAFPECAFDGFREQRVPDDGSKPYWIFNTGKKKEFAEAVAISDQVDWFDHFSGLLEKIAEITEVK